MKLPKLPDAIPIETLELYRKSGYDDIHLFDYGLESARLMRKACIKACEGLQVRDVLDSVRVVSDREREAVTEFTIADLAMTHIGQYTEKEYNFACALLGVRRAKNDKRDSNK
jgi:hypothetical protein